MASPDILFKGIPRTPTRTYTAEVIKDLKPSLVVVPCTGSFSLPFTAKSQGVPRIFAGDVSLYSTAIASALGVYDGFDVSINNDAPERYASIAQEYFKDGDPIKQTAAILLIIRAIQYDREKQKVWQRDNQRELLINHKVYIDTIVEQIRSLKSEMTGVSYKPQDMWLTMEQFKNEPNCVYLVNPPRYTGGYVRMFKGIDSVFNWSIPEYTEFTEADYERLMNYLADEVKATSLMYYATQGEDPALLWGNRWRSVFADKPSNSGRAAINWIISNANSEVVVSRSRLSSGSAKYPLFTGEIKPNSKLFALPMDADTAHYYKDLFIHKLQGSMSEIYAGLFIDGALFAVCGIHLQNYKVGGVNQPANLTFCFSVNHQKYARLHKLALMSIVSSYLWDDILGRQAWYQIIGRPQKLQSTMLTPHPENKTARGILTLKNREKQKDGTFKLSYYGDIIERNSEVTIQEWLKKFGGVAK